jgi:hypothetical protein
MLGRFLKSVRFGLEHCIRTDLVQTFGGLDGTNGTAAGRLNRVRSVAGPFRQGL